LIIDKEKFFGNFPFRNSSFYLGIPTIKYFFRSGIGIRNNKLDQPQGMSAKIALMMAFQVLASKS